MRKLTIELTEEAYMQNIIDAARKLGYLVYHTHDSRRSAAGFPDLCLARRARVLFIEVKSEKGIISPEQQLWLDTLAQCEGLEVYASKPSEWEDTLEILTRDTAPTRLEGFLSYEANTT